MPDWHCQYCTKLCETLYDGKSLNSEHLEVEESINCQRDALTLTALAPNKKQIGRFCGEKGTIQQEIKSDANDVIIVFKQGLHL